MPEDPILRAGYDMVAAKDARRPGAGRAGSARGSRSELAERLVERGILERREGKMLGLFPRKRWPAADATREQEVRRNLTAVLVQGVEPDERTAALVALLSAIDKAHKVVDHEGLPRQGGPQARQGDRRGRLGREGGPATRSPPPRGHRRVTAAVRRDQRMQLTSPASYRPSAEVEVRGAGRA